MSSRTTSARQRESSSENLYHSYLHLTSQITSLLHEELTINYTKLHVSRATIKNVIHLSASCVSFGYFFFCLRCKLREFADSGTIKRSIWSKLLNTPWRCGRPRHPCVPVKRFQINDRTAGLHLHLFWEGEKAIKARLDRD